MLSPISTRDVVVVGSVGVLVSANELCKQKFKKCFAKVSARENTFLGGKEIECTAKYLLAPVELW